MRGKRGKPTACTWHWFVFMDEALGRGDPLPWRLFIASIQEEESGPSAAVEKQQEGTEGHTVCRFSVLSQKSWKSMSSKARQPAYQYVWKNVLFFCIHFCLERHLPICLKGLKYAMTYTTIILMACANKGPVWHFTWYGPNALIEIKQK